MNKNEFIKELSKQTKFDEEKCILINSILEDTFIIGKRNKENIIEKFKFKLGIDENDANNLYKITMNIIDVAIKNKLKHPFKNQD